VLPPTVAKISMTKPTQATIDMSVDDDNDMLRVAEFVCSTDDSDADIVELIDSVNVRVTL
jgi:hypothetical protein